MNCKQAEVLMHALLDRELSAEHAADIAAHLASCRGCAARFGQYRALLALMPTAGLRSPAPPGLRMRINAVWPTRQARAAHLRTLLKGFSAGCVLSAAAAAAILSFAILRANDAQLVLHDAVSAHRRPPRTPLGRQPAESADRPGIKLCHPRSGPEGDNFTGD